MTPIAALDTVTVDATDTARLAAFYSEMLALPIVDSGDDFAQLTPFGEGGPSLLFLKVPEQKATGKNRLHLDFRVDDVAEATRLCEKLGAQRVTDGPLAGPFKWQVMLDPEGNEFCLCPSS